MSVTKYRRLWLILLLVACVAIYWPGLHGPFLFDDFPNLAALTSIDHLSSWRDLGIYLSQPRSFPGRPLAMLSFLAQKAYWPDHPFPFKVVNLGIHLLCGLLVYRLTAVLARHYHSNGSGTLSTAAASLAALLATAAWLLNPIQISGVLLVVQRMTLLMALFVLLGLLAYLKGLSEESGEISRGAWMFLGLGICMVLAFLCKENGLLLPLFALVLDATIMRSQVTGLPWKLRWWRRFLIWPTVLFVLAYLLTKLPQIAASGGLRDFTLGERLMTEPRVLFDYVGNIFLPRFGLYGLYHDGFVVSRSLLTPWTTLPAIVGVLAAAIVGFIARRRWPLLALAILWYLGGQLMESSTLMLELYFEHRNYVPILGPFVALAIGLVGIREPTLRKQLMGLSTLWLAAAALTTLLSLGVYRSEDRLATAWAANQPESIRAQTMLADRLYQHGQPALALARIDSILAKNQKNAGLAENATYLKCMMGTLIPTDMQALTTLLHNAPFDRAGFGNIDNLRFLAQANKCKPLNTQSWKLLVHTLLENPNYFGGVASGYLHYQLHKSAVAEGNLRESVRQLDAAWAKDPDAEIPRLQAQYFASAGLYDRAIATLQHVDYNHLPLLRRLLVNDRAINKEAIEVLRRRQIAHIKSSAPSSSSGVTGPPSPFMNRDRP